MSGPKLTPEEIRNVNDYQESDCWHPMTCGNDSRHAVLAADEDGLRCRECDWKQTWIPQFVKDGLWREHAAKMNDLRSALGGLQVVRRPPLSGTVAFDADPHGPAAEPGEWEAG